MHVSYADMNKLRKLSMRKIQYANTKYKYAEHAHIVRKLEYQGHRTLLKFHSHDPDLLSWWKTFWGRILGCSWDKSIESFLLAIHSHLFFGFYPAPPPPPNKSGSKLVCNVNNVYGFLKSENSQKPQKPQRNCTFMNSASELKSRAPVIPDKIGLAELLF